MNNNRIKIFMLVALLISALSVTCAAAPSLSNSGGGSWSNYREITITNSGSALTDYQVFVQLSGSSFPTTTSNGADIRFTDASGNELSYWTENWDYGGKSAQVWVKIPSISPGAKNIIRMYSGNPSAASGSNGDLTFEFFDDFNSLTGWSNYNANIMYSTLEGKSIVTIEGRGEILSPLSIKESNYAFESMSRLTSGMEAYMPFFGFGSSDRTDNEDNAYQFGYNVYNGHFWDDIRIFKNPVGMVATVDGDDSHSRRSGWTKTSFMVFDGTLTQKIDDSSKGMQTTTLTDISSWRGVIPKEVGIIVWNGASYAVDWILVRKYTSQEPTLALGAEQPTSGTISITSSPLGAEVVVDGVSKGTAPVTISNATTGLHSVKCRLSGYADYDTTATVTAGATTSVTCNMPQSNGNISVSSSPSGAEVLIDGASKGTAPITIPNVSPGSHAVKCKLSGYADFDTSANVTAESTSSMICSLNPMGELSVKLTSEPASIQPGQISTIKISVTKDGAPVSGVNVMLSSTPNVKFSPSSGTTTNGEFISTFTTSTEGEIKVSALAKKEGITDGKGDTIVLVGKTTTPNTSKQALITGKVIDAGTDDPLQEVTITVDGKSVVTGSNGEYELLVNVGKHNLNASKSGYITITKSLIVPDVGAVFDLSLKPASSVTSWFWIVIILLILVVAAGIIYLLYRKKNQKSDAKKEKVEAKKEERKVEGAAEKKKFCMFCHAPISLDSEYCNKCGKKQDETKRFCMNCGALMPSVPELCGKCSKMPPSGEDTKTCKNCGEVIPIVAKFCSACGAGQPE